MFVYQSASLNYYEPMEDWEVEENTNIDVVEEIEDNHLRSSKYVKAQVNVLDEVPCYTHIKGTHSWIKQSTQPKHVIMNMWIRRWLDYFQGFMQFMGKNDM
jgi:hypothetical protein